MDMVRIIDKDFSIEKIARSGQCFRLNSSGSGTWQLLAGSRALELRELDEESAVEAGLEPGFGADLCCSPEEYEGFWKSYFDMDADYGFYRASVDPQDAFLTEAAKEGRGIRILRQDPWEMIITFIISQRKNIPAIKSCVEALCSRFGEPIKDGADGAGPLYAFPSAEALAGASEEELRACSLGYRAPYIKATAQAVLNGDLDPYRLYDLSNEELLDALMGLKGVGVKVANCVMLFAYHRIDAFPIDVWISRMLEEHYAQGFPYERYQGFAGIMQQYMFFHAISNK